MKRQAPAAYSKDLIEQIFRQPYCKIAILERAGLGKRQTCCTHLRELDRLGALMGQKICKKVYCINQALIEFLTRWPLPSSTQAKR